jgi:hypothetical protein
MVVGVSAIQMVTVSVIAEMVPVMSVAKEGNHNLLMVISSPTNFISGTF